jgi:hypothetical protein
MSSPDSWPEHASGTDAAPGTTPADDSRRSNQIAGSNRRGPRRGPVPLDQIGIAGLTRSRVAWFAGVLLVGWVIAGFIGQAGDTTRAAERAAAVRAENRASEREVAGLRAEVSLVTEPRWVAQQARSYNLGSSREIPFVLAPGASPLPADAPGSAARRLGTTAASPAPLDVWMTVLFGSGD